jgi:hypothetical protein
MKSFREIREAVRRWRADKVLLRAVNVHKREYPHDWPFVRDKVKVSAWGNAHMAAIVIICDGKPYALNGTAMSWARRYGLGNLDDILIDPRAPFGFWMDEAFRVLGFKR